MPVRPDHANWPPCFIAKSRFDGCGEKIELESGYFFPVRHMPPERTWTIYIATEISWTFGAPALLVMPSDESNAIVDVGVFVGRVLTDGMSLDVH
jgi:hypothetical protein